MERRVDISNYVIFAPIFFVSIGLKTDISGLTPEILLFSVCFVLVALLAKIHRLRTGGQSLPFQLGRLS